MSWYVCYDRQPSAVKIISCRKKKKKKERKRKFKEKLILNATRPFYVCIRTDESCMVSWSPSLPLPPPPRESIDLEALHMPSKFQERRNCFNFTKVTQKISGFTSNVTDLSFVYAEEGERKILRNIRRNTFGIVLEGDVVKRSANNARAKERGLCGPRRRGIAQLSPLSRSAARSNSKGHQRKS